MNGKKEEKREPGGLEGQLYLAGLCLPPAAALFFYAQEALSALLPETFLVPCVFYAVTGLYCPGCGGTRAVAALLDGKLALSFLYHPVVPYFAALYAGFMISHTAGRLLHFWQKRILKRSLLGERRIGMRYRNGYLYAALAIVLLNAAVKNIALTAFCADVLKWLDAHALIKLL